MNTNWYCTDCQARITDEEVAEHEDEGHTVKGKLRPERLLSNDPWDVGDDVPADGGGES